MKDNFKVGDKVWFTFLKYPHEGEIIDTRIIRGEDSKERLYYLIQDGKYKYPTLPVNIFKKKPETWK